MPSTPIKLGDPVLLSLTAHDGASGLFPQAHIYDSNGIEESASPFDLTEVGATGRYTSSAFVPTSTETFTALFITYTDAPHTSESFVHGRVEEMYPVDLVQTAASGATINTPANASSILTTGTTVSGDVTETEQLDSVYWQIEDDTGTLDMYFEFAISADGSPVSVTMTGRVNGNNDSLDVFAWNWSGAAWDQIGMLVGQGNNADNPHVYNLFATHVGTGGDLGKVRVRFQNTGLTSADLFVDQIFLSYAVINRSVGYEFGAIWIDTTGGGTAGTTPFINGTADNPVDSLVDAVTLSGSTNLKTFALSPGSSISLGQTFNGYVFFGDRWTVALNGQAIPNSVIRGATVSGICTGVTRPRFERCAMGVVTVPPCDFTACPLEGARITLGSAGDFFWDQCFSGVAGTGTYVVDFGVAVGTTNLNMRHYSGGAEFENMGQAGTDLVSLEGYGQYILNANCIGGTVACRGNFDRTDNSGGAVAFSDDARFTRSEVAADVNTVLSAAHGPGAWNGFLAVQGIQLQEIWASLGLNLAAPASFDFPSGFVQALANVTPIDIVISVVGTTVTLSRQP